MKPIRIIIVALAFASLFTACNKQEPVTPESQLTGTSWKGSAVEGDGIDGIYELHLSFLNDAREDVSGSFCPAVTCILSADFSSRIAILKKIATFANGRGFCRKKGQDSFFIIESAEY